MLCAHDEQVAERALYYWNNEFIVSFMAQHITEILPIVYPALCTVSKSHWNRYVHAEALRGRILLTSRRTIHGMVYNALRLMLEMNPEFFAETQANYKEQCRM